MQTVPGLQDKIDLLLPRARGLLETGVEERVTRRSLAGYLGIDDRRLSEFVRGNAEKGIKPDRVPEPILGKLAELLAKVIGGCSLADATALWIGDLADFKIALGGSSKLDLFETLARSKDEIAIAVARKKMSTLRAIRSAEIVPAGAVEITSNERIQFEIRATQGRRLMVLCREPFRIWRVIAPGNLHDGSVETSPTILPKHIPQWLQIDEPLGIHEFVFIEHDKALDPLIPRSLPADRTLDAADIADLALKLANPRFAQRWRWAIRVIDAKKSRSRGRGPT